MTAIAFESDNHSLGMSLLKKGIKIYKEEIEKFFEYFEAYTNDKQIMNLIDSIKD